MAHICRFHTGGSGQVGFLHSGGPSRITFSQRSTNARPANSRTTLRSMPGWKLKSNCSSVLTHGRRACFSRDSIPRWCLPFYSCCSAMHRNVDLFLGWQRHWSLRLVYSCCLLAQKGERNRKQHWQVRDWHQFEWCFFITLCFKRWIIFSWLIILFSIVVYGVFNQYLS